MPTLELTPEQRDRIEQLRAALTDDHAGPYATVGTGETITYLLDLADAVDDPGHRANPDELAVQSTPEPPFDRDAARNALEDRNLRHSDPESTDRLDLHGIAAAFDVTGRSDMQKDELVEAILDRATTLSVTPFALVDLELPGQTSTESTHDSGSSPDSPVSADETAGGDHANDGGAGQLNAMMQLLDTHADKWGESAGDARYEVELPDGRVEAARTKDDVRALLFKHY
jgi:hypothetical protein